jgi:exocyst complex component 4
MLICISRHTTAIPDGRLTSPDKKNVSLVLVWCYSCMCDTYRLVVPVMEARIDDVVTVATPANGVLSSPTKTNGELPTTTQQGPRSSSRFSRYLHTLSTKPSQDPMLDYRNAALGTIAESTISHRRSIGTGQIVGSAELGNVEMDSYGYMEVLMEALAVLGRLGSALEVIAQRVAGEVHALVEATLDEVEER